MVAVRKPMIHRDFRELTGLAGCSVLPSRTAHMKLKPLAFLLAAAFAAPGVMASANGVVISQVFGGGGNSGAVLKSDFIELFNGGSAAVNLKGWSLQYGSASGLIGGQASQIAKLSDTDLLLAPGHYLLVKGADGTGGSQNLPTPDVITTLALSGTDGKIALVSSTAALNSADPKGAATLVDLVGYGTAAAFEGTGAAGSSAPPPPPCVPAMAAPTRTTTRTTSRSAPRPRAMPPRPPSPAATTVAATRPPARPWPSTRSRAAASRAPTRARPSPPRAS